MLNYRIHFSKIACVGLLLFCSVICCAQQISSGTYQSALDLAYDPQTNRITGYYESCGGWDELTQDCRFSCSFYLMGELQDKMALIKTYYPASRNDDSISGKMRVVNAAQIYIRLEAEHGGCANVQPFAADSVEFQLYRPAPWIQIRWVQNEFAYFHSAASAEKRKKTFLRKNEVVYIDKVKGKWVHVVAHEKQHLSGWMLANDLNQ